MSERLREQLSRLSVTVHCEIDSEGQGLVRHLQRTRCRVRHIWPAPDRIGDDADLVLCALQRGVSQRLAWVPGEAKAALILLLPASGQFDLAEVRAAAPDAVIHRPYQAHAIDVALLLGLDHFTYARRLRTRITRLDDTIKSLRDIERAKQVIMHKHDVGEQDAFRLLRDMAMTKRVTVAEIATKIADS